MLDGIYEKTENINYMNKYPQSGNQTQETRQKKDKDRFVRVNWKIKAYECRVIEEGKAPRIMKTKDAIDYAQDLGLDLVEVGYDSRSGISTAKICDWGKYQYEQKQREKAAKKAARAAQTELKCLQMSLTTDTADLDRMISHAKEFLEEGDRVKISLRFRNRRELTNLDMAKDIMKSVLMNFDGLVVLDSSPTLNGKELSCILRRGTIKQKQQSPGKITITAN